MYYSEGGSQGRIVVCNLQGEGCRPLLLKSTPIPWIVAMTLDISKGTIFWLDDRGSVHMAYRNRRSPTMYNETEIRLVNLNAAYSYSPWYIYPYIT